MLIEKAVEGASRSLERGFGHNLGVTMRGPRRGRLGFAGQRSSGTFKGAALPSPKRLAFAEALAQAGYAQAGLKLFQHPRPPFRAFLQLAGK